jgi:hypothetical protein
MLGPSAEVPIASVRQCFDANVFGLLEMCQVSCALQSQRTTYCYIASQMRQGCGVQQKRPVWLRRRRPTRTCLPGGTATHMQLVLGDEREGD